MSQSAVIGAALLGMFLVFLTIRGRLGTYGGALFGATAVPVPGGSSSGSSGVGGLLDMIPGGLGTAAEIGTMVFSL